MTQEGQIALMENGNWRFSVIDDGYGSDVGLLEVGIWETDDIKNGPVHENVRVLGFLEFSRVLELYKEFMENPEGTYWREMR